MKMRRRRGAQAPAGTPADCSCLSGLPLRGPVPLLDASDRDSCWRLLDQTIGLVYAYLFGIYQHFVSTLV